MAQALIQQHGDPLATPGLAADVSGGHQHLAAAQQLVELLCIGLPDDFRQGAAWGRVLGDLDLAAAALFGQAHRKVDADFVSDQRQNTG